MSAGSNEFGNLFKWTSFGESHGPAMGVVIDGCPSGLEFNTELLLSHLAKRKPGQPGTTARNEQDQPEILSGVYLGKTLGTPIAIVVRNQSQKSEDYDSIKNQPRVGHADDVWQDKFGHWDHRGGARASARETLNWVIAGAVAQMLCQRLVPETKVSAQLREVAGHPIQGADDPTLKELLRSAQREGESFGALVEVKIDGAPKSLGEPVFKKAKSLWAQAFMTINACAGVELGAGMSLARSKGTEVHINADSQVYGGIRGGLTTGEEVRFRLAFKPTASIRKTATQGRHDPCVAIRALPVVEAMAWNVLADLLLMKRINKI